MLLMITAKSEMIRRKYDVKIDNAINSFASIFEWGELQTTEVTI